jgi:hypothetical protein
MSTDVEVLAPTAPTAGPVVVPPAPNPAPKLTAIQLIEQEVEGFVKQRLQALANVTAIEGAIQGAQYLLAKLKAEEAKAVNFVETEVEKGIALVEKL